MRTMDQDFARRLEKLHRRNARNVIINGALTLLAFGFIGGLIVVDIFRGLRGF